MGNSEGDEIVWQMSRRRSHPLGGETNATNSPYRLTKNRVNPCLKNFTLKAVDKYPGVPGLIYYRISVICAIRVKTTCFLYLRDEKPCNLCNLWLKFCSDEGHTC